MQAVMRDFGWLAGREQALVAGPEARIAADRRQGGHVEHGVYTGAAAPDAAAAAPGAAVAVEGGDPDQGGDLLAGAGAQFRQFGQQGGGGHGPDARNALQLDGTAAQGGLGLHGGRQIPIRLLDQARHPRPGARRCRPAGRG